MVHLQEPVMVINFSFEFIFISFYPRTTNRIKQLKLLPDCRWGVSRLRGSGAGNAEYNLKCFIFRSAPSSVLSSVFHLQGSHPFCRHCQIQSLLAIPSLPRALTPGTKGGGESLLQTPSHLMLRFVFPRPHTLYCY